ncbi:MAG: hypothetical protein OEV92_09145 [Nitrospinota bacterium]|nr:hypothetical protein [Nitrospinota bacterium]
MGAAEALIVPMAIENKNAWKNRMTYLKKMDICPSLKLNRRLDKVNSERGAPVFRVLRRNRRLLVRKINGV